MRVLIADDEEPARRRLRRMLEAADGFEVVGEAADGLSALNEITRLTPDAVFLDIEMPELDGLGVAEAIQNNGPAIVFVTAYDRFALKAFEACAVDYLLKPVTQLRLSAALVKLRKRAQKPAAVPELLKAFDGTRPTRFAVRSGARYVVFDPARISAVLAQDHYAAIRVDGRELLSDDSLEELEKRLDPRHFLRVHRGAILNISFIKELEREGDRKYVAVLADGFKVQVSRERLAELKTRLGI